MLVLAARDRGIAAVTPVARDGALDRDLERHVQPNREIPAAFELRSRKKHAVEQQHGVSRGGSWRRLDGSIGAIVEHRGAKATAASGSERIDQLAPQCGVVERIEEVAFGRVGAAHVARGAWIVKSVDGRPDYLAARTP